MPTVLAVCPRFRPWGPAVGTGAGDGGTLGFVDHDPGQPGDKAGAAFKLVEACKSTGVGFLHDVLNGLLRHANARQLSRGRDGQLVLSNRVWFGEDFD